MTATTANAIAALIASIRQQASAPIAVSFAKGCAWRAIYLSRMARNIDFTGRDWGVSRHQFFHLGIDPTGSRGPTLFGGIVNPWNRRGWHFKWRFRLPCLRWKYPAGPLYLRAYRISSAFWHALDGRYGALRPGVFAAPPTSDRLRSAPAVRCRLCHAVMG